MTPARIEHIAWWYSCNRKKWLSPWSSGFYVVLLLTKLKKLSQWINVWIFFFIMTLLYFRNMLQNMDCLLKALVLKGPILPHANSIPSELETVTSLVQLYVFFFISWHNSEVKGLINLSWSLILMISGK